MINQSNDFALTASGSTGDTFKLYDESRRKLHSILVDPAKDYKVIIKEAGGGEKVIGTFLSRCSTLGQILIGEMIRTGSVVITVTDRSNTAYTAYVALVWE